MSWSEPNKSCVLNFNKTVGCVHLHKLHSVSGDLAHVQMQSLIDLYRSLIVAARQMGWQAAERGI
jgi:hypothetical protein